MCVMPGTLRDGTVIACRKCWQCRENRINDWVGRCIAESRTATRTFSVTLTYGRDSFGRVDHERAAVLTYTDVQEFMHLLRKRAGYSVRYFCVGEYGAEKGRAHWHIILFFYGEAPKWPLRENFNYEHWDHGHIFVDAPSYEAVRYACKYILKKIGDDEAQGHMGLSKKPPLGAEYFSERAKQYARQGLAPQSAVYSFPEARTREGKPREFMLAGRSLELFLESYMFYWRAIHPSSSPHARFRAEGIARRSERLRPDGMPYSELVEKYLDGLARADARLENIRRPPRPRGMPKPFLPVPDGYVVRFNEAANLFVASHPNQHEWTRPLYWALNSDGEWKWLKRIGRDAAWSPTSRESYRGPRR